jgi:hypothetical protein
LTTRPSQGLLFPIYWPVGAGSEKLLGIRYHIFTGSDQKKMYRLSDDRDMPFQAAGRGGDEDSVMWAAKSKTGENLK